MTFFLQLLLTGLMVGMVYSVVALGFVLIFKASSVLNFAQGEFLLFSAYFLWTILVPLNLPIWLAFPILLIFATILGLLVERFTLRPMIGQPLVAIIMMTLGLMALVRGIVMLLWGGEAKDFPRILPIEPITIGQIALSQQYIWSFVIAVSLFIFFALFFQRTKQGLAMRATAADQQVAQSMGISVKRVLAMSWIISMVVASIGGFLLGTLNGVTPFLGVVGLKVLPVVLMGGMESIGGAAIAGPVIGILESLAGGYINPIIGGGVNDIAPFFIIILVLLIKPYGFFGLKRIERI